MQTNHRCTMPSRVSRDQVTRRSRVSEFKYVTRQSSVSDQIAWNRKVHSFTTRHHRRPTTSVSCPSYARAIRSFGAPNTSREKESSAKVAPVTGGLYTPARTPRHVVNHASPNHLSPASVTAVGGGSSVRRWLLSNSSFALKSLTMYAASNR